MTITNAEINATLERLFKSIGENASTRSAWARGVKQYAKDLLFDLDTESIYKLLDLARDGKPVEFYAILLNGANDWYQFSFGGCSLIYNCDIDERLNPPSCRGKSSSTSLLEAQARALAQASRLIYIAFKRI